MDVYFCGSDIFNLLPTSHEASHTARQHDSPSHSVQVEDLRHNVDDNDIRGFGKLLTSPVKCDFKESIGIGDVILTRYHLVLLDRKESLLKIFGRDDGVEFLYLPNTLSSDEVRISSFCNNLLVIGDTNSSPIGDENTSIGEDCIPENNYMVSLDETSLGMCQIERFESGDCGIIAAFSFGETFGLLLDTGGNLFKIMPDRSDEDAPFVVSPVEKPVDLQVVSVSCGNEHAVVLMANGDVYTMGGGSRGQLGLGSMSSEDRLCLVESLQPLKIVKVSAGGWHSLAMADTGDLYGWGWNESGQVGVAVDDDSSIPPQMVSLPQLVETPLEDTFVSMATGSRHSISVSSTGDVYSWGCCNYGQLGQGDQKNKYLPTKVSRLPCNAVDVSCTKNGTFIYCKKVDHKKEMSNGDHG